METKTCSKCGQEKPISEFYKHKGRCKDCIREYSQTHRKGWKDRLQQKTGKRNTSRQLELSAEKRKEERRISKIERGDTYRSDKEKLRALLYSRKRYQSLKDDNEFKKKNREAQKRHREKQKIMGVFKEFEHIIEDDDWSNIESFV